MQDKTQVMKRLVREAHRIRYESGAVAGSGTREEMVDLLKPMTLLTAGHSEELVDWIARRRSRIAFRKREDEARGRRANLEDLLPIVVPDGSNLHSTPSDSSCAISARIRRVADPFMGF